VVDGAVRNEGNVEIGVEPYPIAYRALTPKREECTNLLVPVALSSTHIAFGSIRMEPVFMLLGQSAATAACFALDDGVAVQDVPYPKLRAQLLSDRQILEYTGPRRHASSSIEPGDLKGVIVDNADAELSGTWQTGNVTHPRVGGTYLHDGNTAKGESVARFRTTLPEAGLYEVCISWPPNPNRATNVPVTVYFAGGKSKTLILNQQKAGDGGSAFTSLGIFELDTEAVVEIGNDGTNGYVIADAVQWIHVGEK
jgi:hypothetical protein